MDKLAKNAINKKLGLWRACPGTKYDPYEAIETRRQGPTPRIGLRLT